MTLGSGTRKSNGKVSGSPVNFYERWRDAHLASDRLHEGGFAPDERLLQAIWFHQRLLRERLCTTEGRVVRVLHPGYWNRGAGPDFRGAIVQFGDDPPQHGDVEVDVRASGWRGHGHAANAAFAGVVLHVIWRPGDALAGSGVPSRAPTPPTLALAEVLDAPLTELAAALRNGHREEFPEVLRGRCCAPLRELADSQRLELLRQAGWARFRDKARAIQAAARQRGWEQALWEGLFRALGYRHNTWPMLRLAELRERFAASSAAANSSREPASILAWQARLLGTAGLLPTELPRRSGTHDYLRSLWDVWWRERDEFADYLLPSGIWRLHGLRPANQPHRRLALAARWLATGNLPRHLERWGLAPQATRQLCSSLRQALETGTDAFWSRHWTLRSERFEREQPLLGAARATDLAVNVILPWLWVRATEGGNHALAGEMERRYMAWPAAEDNAILRLARERLLGGTRPGHRFAALQQGLLQIVRDFCEGSDSLCGECQFPVLVRGWAAPLSDTASINQVAEELPSSGAD